MLNEVPDDYEILIVKGGEPLWFTGEVVDLAMGEEDGESESLQHAVGLIACDEDGN